MESSLSLTSLQTEEALCWLKDLVDEAEAPNPISTTLRHSSSDSIASFQTSTHQSTSSSSKASCNFNYQSRMIQHKSPQQRCSLPQYCFHPNPSSTTTSHSKRVKRHYAQQSRAMKLQYIAQPERNIQAFEAEGFEVLAESEFLEQQSRILDMENRALRQRLDS